MFLSRIHVENYRSIRTIDLDVGSLTGLIGANGSGKSALLGAVSAFYGEGPILQPQDWYASDTSKELEVRLTFTDLSPEEINAFETYLGPAQELEVARVWRLEAGRIRDTVYGYRLGNPDFDVVRSATRGISALHNNLVDSGKFPGLQRVSRAEDSDPVLLAWESANPQACQKVRDGGKFFAWNQTGGELLARSTACVYVPAVREARDDAAEGKGSSLSRIVDIVLREELRKDPDLAALRETVAARFDEILTKARPALSALAANLSEMMNAFTPGAAVLLDWRGTQPALPDWPLIEARLSEDGVETPVWAKGHGLQRSFIVSLLQRLAEVRAQEAHQEDQTYKHSTLLLIEEPELYQHPLAAKRFARVLRTLAEEEGTQVIYSTHSPTFVSFEHFDSIRRVQKVQIEADLPPATAVVSLALREVGDKLTALWNLDPATVTDGTTRDRLRTVLGPEVSEGFFAKAVILVEGQQDRAMLEGLASARAIDLEGTGTAIVPVGGKGNLDRVLTVFKGFQIPVYLMFDGDKSDIRNRDQNKRLNNILMTLAAESAEDFPATSVRAAVAVFEEELETELKKAASGDWDNLLRACCESCGVAIGRDVLKTPYGCKNFIEHFVTPQATRTVFDELADRIAAFAVR
jgi:putative ATP-dependent endonuclease of the OLD family